MSTVQAFSDHEIQDAIDELSRSTDAINKQTDTLRQQQDALSRLISSSGKNGDARADLEVKRLHKWETDRKALNTAVEILSQSLDYRLSELEQQITGTGDDVMKIVDGMLCSDDKLLSSLQKLGFELDTEDPEETDSVTKLREICARLIKFTAECIRTKLDRVYLESLESLSKSGTKQQATKEEITAQQEELEELYSEVLPVAQMSVEQQWLEPSLRSLSARNGGSVSRSAEALGYVSALVLCSQITNTLQLADHTRLSSASFICLTESTASLIASRRPRHTRLLLPCSWSPRRQSYHPRLPPHPNGVESHPHHPEGLSRSFWTA